MSRPAGKPGGYLVWMEDGFQFFLGELSRVDDERLELPSSLPGWTRKHVAAHVGLNARAARRLVHWAKTGEATPMYSSASARTDEIADGALLSGNRLRQLVQVEQAALSTQMDGLSNANWSTQVKTGQGRTITATEIPWIRAREVWIHAVDLNAGGDFADFPAAFVDKLIDEAVAKHRAGDTPTLEVCAGQTARRFQNSDPGSDLSIPIGQLRIRITPGDQRCLQTKPSLPTMP